MTKRIPSFLLLLALLASFAVPASAAPYTPDYSAYFKAADHYWGPGPCTGRYEIQWGDLSSSGAEAQATGITVGVDGTVLPDGTVADDATWTLTSCIITLDIKQWADDNEAENRCLLIVHEVGHLNMHRHAEGGVMSPNARDAGLIPECDSRSLRQRAIDKLTDRLLQEPGNNGVGWTCGKTHGRTFYCRVEDNRARNRRFQIRLRAPYYNIAEVKI